MKLYCLISFLKHPKITYLTSLLLLLGLGLSQPLLAQKIWTGLAGTSWEVANNWSPSGVPTATDDVEIQTVTPALYPIISSTDAKAKSVFLRANTTLTIANTGKLTINGATSGGTSLSNVGTFENNGQLVLGNENGLVTKRITNTGTIKNNAGATISVDNTSNTAIDNQGMFTNAGTVNVGQTQSVGSYGLNNVGSFENKTGGVLKIGRCSIFALDMGGVSTFVNAGTINIGVGGSVGSTAINSRGSLDNNLGGVITIDNFSNVGIAQYGTFRNYATIIIGATAGGAFGLDNSATFINDGCSALLSVQSNSRIFSGSGATTSNSGTIIEKASGNSNITANTGLVQNLNGGTFDVGAGPLPALVAVGAAPTTFNGGDGSIKIKGLLNDTYELTYSKDGGSPTTTNVAVTTNEITIPSLGVGTYAITVKGTTCSTLEFSLSASVDNPTLTLGTATQPTTCTGTGSIVFTSTGYGGTTQTLSYTYQANGSATAETRTASVSIANDGSFTLSNLPVGIYSQFAIGLIGATGSRVINVLADETTLVWTGCANGEWHNAANWSKLTVPTATDEVTIPTVSSPRLYPTISTTDAKAKSVLINSNTTLTIANTGKLTINGFFNNTSITNSGTFENNGLLVLGNENALGATGIFNEGTFKNNAGATITVDNTSFIAIDNRRNATFTNAGTVNVGQTQSVGQYGIYCFGTFENKTGGVIKISRCTNAALFISSGITFTNAGAINIGNVGAIAFGISTHGNFDNNVGGEITVDNFSNSGIEVASGGTFKNYASIIVGAIAGGPTALSNLGSFSNEGCASLLWVKSNSIIQGQLALWTANAGVIIENASGNSFITRNTGLVYNLNGGTFTIQQPQFSVPVLNPLGAAPSNCPSNNNGSVLLVGVEPNTEYVVTIGVGGTPQNLTSNASGQLSVGSGNLPIGTYTITLKKACWLQAAAITVEVSAASLTNGRSTRGATCATAGLLVFDTNLGFTGTFSTYPATYKRNGVSQSGQMEVSNPGGGNTATISASEGYYTDIKVQYGTCEVAYAGATIYVAGAASPNTITPPTTCAGTNGSLLFTTSANVGTYSLSYKKNGNTVTTDVTVTGSRGRQFTLSNLSAGVYTDFAFTAGACNVTYSPIIRIGDLPNPAVSGTAAVTTVGGSDGSIQLSGLAVSKSYSISYQKDGGTAVTTTASSEADGNLTIANLGGGSYTNIILTINGCSSSALSATVGAPAPAYTFAYSSTVPPSGCGATDGALVFTTNLPVGTNAYTLEYTFLGSPGVATISVTAGSGGSNTFTLSGLRAGAYRDFKIVYNSTNSTIADILTVSDPNKPTFAVGTKTPPSGCTTTDGSIQLTGLAASTSYSVSYQKDASTSVTATLSSDASGNLEISSLGAGAYTNLKVTLNNCVSDAATATLSAPTFTLTQTSSSNPTTCGATDGTLSFSTSLPMGNYTLSYKKNGEAQSANILVGTPRGRVSADANTAVLNGLGAGTYSDFKITYNGCEVTLIGTYTLTTPSLATASVVGTTTVCQNATSVAVTFTGANGIRPYTFEYRINGGAIQKTTTQGEANSATVLQTTSLMGVYRYELVGVADANCSQPQVGTVTVTVQGKPTITLTTQQVTLNEGNNQEFCDIDSNPVNVLQFTASSSCVAGSPAWRVQAGSGAWSSWSAIAPASQPSNNQSYRYQAACDVTCPSTYTNPIEVKINYRASMPQNVSLVADGVAVKEGETQEVCNTEGNTITFNATCAAGEVILYSVDGGEYGNIVPMQLVDGQYHNYRVRCRKSDGINSCAESESGIMRLRITNSLQAPVASLNVTSGCGTPVAFSGTASCGAMTTVWYNATTNAALPTLPHQTPIETSSYYARCQAAGGCLSDKSNIVTYTIVPVNVAPVVSVNSEVVCSGGEVTVSTNCPAGTRALWNTGVTESSFKVSFVNVTKQSYSVRCMSPNGCQSAVSAPKEVTWKAFELTFINIGQSKSAVKTNDRAAWTNQFITTDGGPSLDQSTQQNPTLYFVENVNKTAPRYWTINVDACGLGTSGSLTFDMLVTPETGVVRSYNTHENNAPYFMYANREGWTELYAQNHPAYGFYEDNGVGGNVYDTGLPKGLYKLGIRYWDMKGWGSIYPSTRRPQGNILAYQEYWFRIQSKNGVGVGAARVAESGQPTAVSEEATNLSPWKGLNPSVFATVLPNPVTSVLRLKVEASKGQAVQTVLTDASGRQVMGRTFVAETNAHQEEFGVSELPTGMYFLKVTTPEKQAMLKVVKQ